MINKKVVALIGILCGLYFSFYVYAAEISSIDIINKVQQNFDLIQDLRANLSITATIEGNSSNRIIQKLRHTMKKPDKIKIEDINNNRRIDNYFNNISQNNIFMENILWPDPTLLFTIKSYLENFTITSKYDSILNLYIIAAIPKSQTKEFPKMEWFVDYEKGVVVKILIYNVTGHLDGIIEIEYKQITDKILFPSKIIDTIIASLNTTKKEIIYENIEINTNIGDNEF